MAKVRDLDNKPTQSLLSALREVPWTFNADSLSSAIAARVDTIAASDVERIVPALLHLYSIKDVSELPASDVAEGVARGMEEETVPRRLRSSPKDRDSFQARLLELLGIDPLDVVTKAGGLMFENEHSLRQARIVTDIRPVFERDNPKAAPRGAVIVHTLKISYWADNSELKEFFVALDTKDVGDLSEQLARANAKAESLKSVLDAAQVNYIDSE
ncbi:MAG: hypothetical protein CYG60_16215 [Actinobacteria bacterium]|nr:MAG: hypothetical protein CYG60_16215 [Actinomycetota bacterium]